MLNQFLILYFTVLLQVMDDNDSYYYKIIVKTLTIRISSSTHTKFLYAHPQVGNHWSNWIHLLSIFFQLYNKNKIDFSTKETKII